MHLDSVYYLVEGVQVRKEAFGLLFYDYRGPRLYFVPSRNLITDAFFEGKERVADLLDRLCDEMPWPRQRIHDQVGHMLNQLDKKDLVYEQ